MERHLLFRFLISLLLVVASSDLEFLDVTVSFTVVNQSWVNQSC